MNDALYNADITSVRRLLKGGADPNDSYRGTTALHRAVRKAYVGIVKMLLKAGADHRVPDNKGATALDLYRKEHRTAILSQWEAAEASRVATQARSAEGMFDTRRTPHDAPFTTRDSPFRARREIS